MTVSRDPAAVRNEKVLVGRSGFGNPRIAAVSGNTQPPRITAPPTLPRRPRAHHQAQSDYQANAGALNLTKHC
jgi:hypothetical protein